MPAGIIYFLSNGNYPVKAGLTAIYRKLQLEIICSSGYAILTSIKSFKKIDMKKILLTTSAWPVNSQRGISFQCLVAIADPFSEEPVLSIEKQGTVSQTRARA